MQKRVTPSIPLFEPRKIATKDFYFGLIGAISFHCLMLFLFRISPQSPSRELPPLPSIQVEAILTSPQKSLLPAKNAPFALFEKRKPSLEELPFPSDAEKVKNFKEPLLEPNSPFEKIPYQPGLIHDF